MRAKMYIGDHMPMVSPQVARISASAEDTMGYVFDRWCNVHPGAVITDIQYLPGHNASTIICITYYEEEQA